LNGVHTRIYRRGIGCDRVRSSCGGNRRGSLCKKRKVNNSKPDGLRQCLQSVLCADLQHKKWYKLIFILRYD